MAKYTLEDLLSIYQNRLLQKPENDVKEVISTGIFSLDLSTDIGGVPKSRLTTIYGEGGAGKTTVAMHIVREALKKNNTVLYVDVENTLDTDYLKKICGDYAEKLNTYVTVISDTDSGRLLNQLYKIIEGGIFDVIILDSVGALISVEEVDKDVNQKTVAGIARILSPFLRKAMTYVYENNIALVFLNQVRANIGNPFASYLMPGGNVLNHASSIIMRFSPSSKIKDNKNNIIGQWTKVVVEKNKVGVPYRNVKFPIIFGEGVDNFLDITTMALEHNILKRRGPYYYYIDIKSGELVKLGRGIDETIDKLKENPNLTKTLRNQIFEIFEVKQKGE